MAGFRGIGDAATEVKMKQDQMALQASTAAASRAQQDSQFNKRMAAEQENTAWERSQQEQKNELAQQATGRMEQRQERQLSIEDFRKNLDMRRTDAELGQRDVQTQVARAQLSQYTAAADDRKKADAAREKRAGTALAGLLIATELNGGVAPPEALELFNKETGDANNRAVGMGRDPVTGLAFVNLETTDPQTGKKTPTTRNMSPENQYAALYTYLSKDDAEDWHNRYTAGSTAQANSELGRIKFKEQETSKIAEEQRKLEAERNDPVKQEERNFKRAEMFQKQAEALEKMTAVGYDPDMTEEERKGHRKMAATYRKMANGLLIPQEEKPKPFALAPEMQTALKIQPGFKYTTNPQTGGPRVVWTDTQGRANYQDFGQDGKPLNTADEPAPAPKVAAKPASAPNATSPAPAPTKPTQTSGELPDNAALRRYEIRIKRDASGKPLSAEIPDGTFGRKTVSVAEAIAEYERLENKKAEDKAASAKRMRSVGNAILGRADNYGEVQ